MFLQRTIRKKIEVKGIGLHTGQPTRLTLCPAPEGTGIYLIRNDLAGCPAISVRAEYVQATDRATTLGGGAFSVLTVEHCLAVLAAFRIDNLFIELDGPEIPIGDGSAKIFLDALLEAGVVEQRQPKKYAYISRPIYYGVEEKYAYVAPYNGLRVSCTVEFPHPKIGRQTMDLDINEHSFAREIARARTFGFMRDVESMRARGLVRGGNLSNAVVLDNSEILNPEGLRYPDEFVRHKILDALGDLATLGIPLMGHLVLYKAGHGVMSRLVRAILDSPDCYRHIELGADLPKDVFVGRHLWTASLFSY